MAAVRMFISKFGREVLIDPDHPLAIAQKGAAPVAAAPAEPELLTDAPQAPAEPESEGAAPVAAAPAEQRSRRGQRG